MNSTFSTQPEFYVPNPAVLHLRSQLKSLKAQRRQQALDYAITGEPEKSPLSVTIQQSIRTSIDNLKRHGLGVKVKSLIEKDRAYQYHELARLARELCAHTPVEKWSVRVQQGSENHGIALHGEYGATRPAIVFEFNNHGFIAKTFLYNYQLPVATVH
ncbi:hypothetical protein [Vibrio fluvialis]|uniref:hypothetical protein n=1 Tax=Vibrio fluvialis TaxID=676 RepID=UPI00130272ED|nr:hypothetical protein [Vibrio fluvialis]